MDGQKFDKLTRAFATGTDRRTLIKILGGATLAGVAGVPVARPKGVLGQGNVGPGGVCTSDEQCARGATCYIQGDPGAEGICQCGNVAEPWIGCMCAVASESPCGDDLLCCGASTTPGSDGTCQIECDPVGECSGPDSSCAETDCCTYGECGPNGWCTSCISGTENPCGNLNENFGAEFICCTYGGEIGSVGICVTEAECIVEPPNTGAGSASDNTAWIAPAAAIGAAAAVLAYKSRESRSDSEA